MKVSYINDKFICQATFQENEAVKQAGFRWDADLKAWASHDYRCAEQLLKYCDQSAIYQIRFLKQDIQNAVAQSAKAQSSINVLHPPTVKPYPYQIAGVEYMLPRAATLLADQMGLGKSAEALLVMNMRPNIEALIVCPSILKYNWLKEARKWLVGYVTAYIYEPKSKIRFYRKQLTGHNKHTILHIINYDNLEKYKDRLLGTPYNFFIADESVYIKNQDSLRTQICQQLARRAMWKIFITGTPIYNKPKDLFVPLNLIDPEMFGNAFKFYQRYCGAQKKKFNGRQVVLFDGATNIDELNQLLRANYMVRRMAKDVLKDLPEKIKDVIVLQESDLEGIVEKEQKALSNSKKQQEQLKAEINKLRDLAQSNEAYKTIYNEKVKTLRESNFKSFGEISRIRKELAIKKVPYVIEFVKSQLESGDDPQSKIVVFGHHREVLESIYASLREYNPVLVYGGVNDNSRQDAIKKFSAKNDCRVFIGSMGSAGSGVDGLQNHCNIMVFAELDWTPALVDQAESRLQRIGQKNTVWVYHIVADGSIDSRIAKIMVEKEELAKQILDYRPEQMYEKLVQSA